MREGDEEERERRGKEEKVVHKGRRGRESPFEIANGEPI